MTSVRPAKLLLAVCLATLAVAGRGANDSRAASAPAGDRGRPSYELPLETGTLWRPWSQIGDRQLQAAMVQALKRRALWRSLLDSGKMAVVLVDLSQPAAPRLAAVNGDTMMYGASLPKLAILLAAFHGFADGSMKETPELRTDLVEMIRRSDNAAAGRLTARIGLGKIEALLTDPRYRFYDRNRGGGLWLGSGYTAGGERHPEPLQNLVHAATANQVGRFYYLLAYGRLISPESSRQMLHILAFPDLHDKFVQALEPEVPLARLYRKSGQWQIWHADSILVWGEPAWRRYILVGLVEHRRGEEILTDLVPVAEDLLRPGNHETRREPNP